MEDLKFWMTITFLSILIFLMGLFVTKSVSHSFFLIYFILSFLLPMLIILMSLDFIVKKIKLNTQEMIKKII